MMADIETLAIRQCIRAFCRSSGAKGRKPVEELTTCTEGNLIRLADESGCLAMYQWRKERWGTRIERIPLDE